MKQLYTDLISTPPQDFLDLSRPALKFISLQRFKSVLWNNDIINSLEKAISVYREEVITVIELMLPHLANGSRKPTSG